MFADPVKRRGLARLLTFISVPFLGGLGAAILDHSGLLNVGLRFVSVLAGLAWILFFPLWENEEP